MANNNQITVGDVTIKTMIINGNFGLINPLEFEGVRKEAGLRLNQIAIQQMQALEASRGRNLQK